MLINKAWVISMGAVAFIMKGYFRKAKAMVIKMNDQKLRDIVKAQLAKDYNCWADDFDNNDTLVTSFSNHPERRRYEYEDNIIKLLAFEGKLVATVDDDLLEWAGGYFAECTGEWFFDIYDITPVALKLKVYMRELDAARLYFIPYGTNIAKKAVQPIAQIRWFERGSLDIFEGDDRFSEALLFCPQTPDMLAVAAYDREDGDIIGMAGASQNSAIMWEIGVNIESKARHKGLASNLVALLAREIVNRGCVPYYGACMSHVLSQRVAYSAGLYPAFCELRSILIEEFESEDADSDDIDENNQAYGFEENQ